MAVFEPQQQVAIRSEDENPFPRATFLAYVNRDFAAVKTEFGLEEVPVTDLVHLADVAAEEAEMVRQQQQIEQEYETVRVQVAEKMQTAANALREATRLVEGSNNSLQEFYDETRPFLRAMDAAGWSTSSLNC